ncbi:MAG: hypothetical protein ACK4MW_03310 [Aquificaceae bacterium]
MRKALLLLLIFSSFSLSQEGNCTTNPLKDKEYCRYFWSLCKSLGLKRLDGIRACLERSQSYEEGLRCFERSWLEDLFSR